MKRQERLSKTEQEELIMDLINALVQSSTLEEAALFLQDLLTKNEIRILSKRLRIAKLLLSGATYEEINADLYVSYSTTAKISAWLTERGEGFRRLIKKLPRVNTQERNEQKSEWERFKRNHSIYFWPELLLEEIIKSANKRQKDRISGVLKTLDEKSELHNRIEKLLRSKL